MRDVWFILDNFLFTNQLQVIMMVDGCKSKTIMGALFVNLVCLIPCPIAAIACHQPGLN
jgi:hypothetical protein